MTDQERVVRLESVLAATVALSHLVSSVRIQRSIDAVVVVYGHGEMVRVTEGIKIAHGKHVKRLIVFGSNENENLLYGSLTQAGVEERVRRQCFIGASQELPFQVHLIPEALNTKDQMLGVLTELERRKATSALLVATGWHLIPRAYLTFVAQALNHPYGTRVKVWPWPAERSLTDRQSAPMPGQWTHLYKTPFDAIQGEVERCEKYVQDVADFDRLQEYLTKAQML